MADNVPVTPGSGADIAADDVGGVYFQRIKLDIGGDGVSSPVVAGNGLPVDTGLTGLATETTLASALTSLQTLDNTVAGNELQVDVVAALPAGNNNIGDVDVLTLPALPAGSNTIGSVGLAANSSTTAATFAQGIKTVAAAATPERLVGSLTLVETVTIQAKKGFNSANTSAVFVGFSASNDSNYLELLPGDSVTLNAPAGKKLDLNLIYIECVTAGDGVTYTSVN